jgi:hypothetical protein
VEEPDHFLILYVPAQFPPELGRLIEIPFTFPISVHFPHRASSAPSTDQAGFLKAQLTSKTTPCTPPRNHCLAWLRHNAQFVAKIQQSNALDARPHRVAPLNSKDGQASTQDPL